MTTTAVRPYRELLPNGEMRHVLDRNNFPVWILSPPFTLMEAIFGDSNYYDNLQGWYETPPYLAEREDGHGVLWGLIQAIQNAGLTPKHVHVLIGRFGLRGGPPKTFDELAPEMDVTRSRIGQLEGKALRRMRHPASSEILRTFMRTRNDADKRAALARAELFDILLKSTTLPGRISGQIVLRLQRNQLRSAFQAVNRGDLRLLNRAVANSCFLQLGKCQMCGEPAIPNSDWCLLHLHLRTQIPMVCDGCGIRFPRVGSTLIAYCRWHGHSQNHLFHNKACFNQNGKRLGVWDNAGGKQKRGARKKTIVSGLVI